MSGPYQPYDISPRRQAFDRAFRRGLVEFQLLVAGHWLFLLNSTAALYVGLAFLAPVLLALGAETAGRFVFDAYAIACHQIPDRSYFIFGHQVAFCQRDVAIFTTVFLAGLAYARVRTRLPRLRWWLYGLIITPMAIDGTLQLLGWHESTWQLRTATGALFGLATVWLLYPYIERTMVDLRLESAETLARGGEAEHIQQGGG